MASEPQGVEFAVDSVMEEYTDMLRFGSRSKFPVQLFSLECLGKKCTQTDSSTGAEE